MNDKIDELLLYVQRTNPDMTKDKLKEELIKCNYVTKSLVNTYELCSKNILQNN